METYVGERQVASRETGDKPSLAPRGGALSRLRSSNKSPWPNSQPASRHAAHSAGLLTPVAITLVPFLPMVRSSV